MDRQETRKRLLAAYAMIASTSAVMASMEDSGDTSSIRGDITAGPAPPAAPAPAGEQDPESLLSLPDLPILVQSIVEPLGKTTDGDLVKTLGPAWKAILKALEANTDALHQLSPRQLEELVAASYDEAGFEEVVLTPRSGDLGRDVIAVKRGFYSVRIIDQVKHFSPGHRVSANDVRALLGVLLSDERATKGIVTTTSNFAPGIATDPFIAKHSPFRLQLIDGSTLVNRLIDLGSKPRHTDA